MTQFTEHQFVLIQAVRQECVENPWMLRHVIDAALTGPSAAVREANERVHKAQCLALFAYNAAVSRRSSAEIKIADGWLREELASIFPNAFRED